MTTWTTRTVFAVLGAAVALTLMPAIASAHASLTGSNPAAGAELATAPDRVTLTFSGPVQSEEATLSVLGPDGAQWASSAPRAEGSELSVNLDGLGPAGRYTVTFRVPSEDGHPVTGDFDFTLTQADPATTPAPVAPTAGAPTPAAEATSAADTSTVAEPAQDNGSAVVWIVAAAVVVLAAAGAVLLWSTRRRG